MKTLFFLLWPVLALFTTGCTTMSRTQCAKSTRVILISNLLFDINEGDSTVVVSCNGIERTLRRDESFEIVQLADSNGIVPAIELTIRWRGKTKTVSYPARKLDRHFFGPQELVDLFLSPSAKDIVLLAF